MPRHESARHLPLAMVRDLHRQSWHHNLKIPLFYALIVGVGAVAWNAESAWLVWSSYVVMGYLWMGIVTFMHDCTHMVLFKEKWKNWVFGIFSTLPVLVTFIAFKEDHLEHHRHNRGPQDPDAFTMGKRRPHDFVLFYAYILIGGILTVIQFNFIYAFQKFRGPKLRIHLGELALRAAVYTGLLVWTSQLGVMGKFVSLWLIPVYIFSVLNSIRFLGEHYDTPWDAGQLAGTRTIISNPVQSFFWNNINYHIGHHVYPAVPWYNLQKLHAAMLPSIKGAGAAVDRSYFGVFFRACWAGPETVERNRERVAVRAAFPTNTPAGRPHPPA
jgi:fatty acid desaturase